MFQKFFWGEAGPPLKGRGGEGRGREGLRRGCWGRRPCTRLCRRGSGFPCSLCWVTFSIVGGLFRQYCITTRVAEDCDDRLKCPRMSSWKSWNSTSSATTLSSTTKRRRASLWRRKCSCRKYSQTSCSVDLSGSTFVYCNSVERVAESKCRHYRFFLCVMDTLWSDLNK